MLSILFQLFMHLSIYLYIHLYINFTTEWQPGMGPPPADFRQGNGPPRRGGGGGGPPPVAPPPMQGMPQFSGYEKVGGFGQSTYMYLRLKFIF